MENKKDFSGRLIGAFGKATRQRFGGSMLEKLQLGKYHGSTFAWVALNDPHWILDMIEHGDIIVTEKWKEFVQREARTKDAPYDGFEEKMDLIDKRERKPEERT